MLGHRCSNCNGETDTAGRCVRCCNIQITYNGTTAPAGALGPIGWICPRCGTVHSPWATNCWCPSPMVTATKQQPPADGE